jgi:hypothetical protein
LFSSGRTRSGGAQRCDVIPLPSRSLALHAIPLRLSTELAKGVPQTVIRATSPSCSGPHCAAALLFPANGRFQGNALQPLEPFKWVEAESSLEIRGEVDLTPPAVPPARSACCSVQ